MSFYIANDKRCNQSTSQSVLTNSIKTNSIVVGNESGNLAFSLDYSGNFTTTGLVGTVPLRFNKVGRTVTMNFPQYLGTVANDFIFTTTLIPEEFRPSARTDYVIVVRVNTVEIAGLLSINYSGNGDIRIGVNVNGNVFVAGPGGIPQEIGISWLV